MFAEPADTDRGRHTRGDTGLLARGPRAIASQKHCRSSRRATGGRPGDRIAGRPAKSDRRRLRSRIATPHVEVLRRPVESAQYLAIRYTQRLADEGAVASVGSRGDSFDNALAEAVNGLYKTELIRRRGPWRTAEQVELATLEWVQWWNQRRLHGAIGHIPPAEHEAIYYREQEGSKEVA
jgi:putative transposase